MNLKELKIWETLNINTELVPNYGGIIPFKRNEVMIVGGLIGMHYSGNVLIFDGVTLDYSMPKLKFEDQFN